MFRVRHPKLRKVTYVSNTIGMKSRIDYFLLAKNLTTRVKKTEIYSSIAPDHNAIYKSLSRSCESARGAGLGKFNNTLLKNTWSGSGFCREKGSIDHTFIHCSSLRNHSYKKSFGGLIQCTIHRSLQLWRNFYLKLPPT